MDRKWRDEFFYRMGREDHGGRSGPEARWNGATIGSEALRGIIAAAGKVQRANEAECSFPEPEPGCWDKMRQQGQRRIAKLLDGTGWTAAYQRDPRGAAVRLLPPGVADADHEVRGIAVPATGYPARAFSRS